MVVLSRLTWAASVCQRARCEKTAMVPGHVRGQWHPSRLSSETDVPSRKSQAPFFKVSNSDDMSSRGERGDLLWNECESDGFGGLI